MSCLGNNDISSTLRNQYVEGVLKVDGNDKKRKQEVYVSCLGDNDISSTLRNQYVEDVLKVDGDGREKNTGGRCL